MIENLSFIRRATKNGTARAIRLSAGLAASEVARELGVSPAAVSRWERGLRQPRGEVAERYAELLRRMAA